MSSKYLEKSVEQIETTIGELIETMTTIAQEEGASEAESYELTSQAMTDLLFRSQKDVDIQIN